MLSFDDINKKKEYYVNPCEGYNLDVRQLRNKINEIMKNDNIAVNFERTSLIIILMNLEDIVFQIRIVLNKEKKIHILNCDNASSQSK